MNYRQFMAQWLSVESFTTKDPSSNLNQVNFFLGGGNNVNFQNTSLVEKYLIAIKQNQ